MMIMIIRVELFSRSALKHAEEPVYSWIIVQRHCLGILFRVQLEAHFSQQ